MRILIVSFFDDNFGDMLIRICFERLLRTALQNLSADDYTVDHMHIKSVDEAKITAADMIFFAGGAMFGMNYLNSFDYIDRITALAEEHDIPVVFSSIGINNKNATEQTAAKLNEILCRRCVRAMSVRESAKVFEPYAEGCGFVIREVCDPAVWTRTIYHNETAPVITAKSREKKVVGINVVRGGLFRANGYQWTLSQQEEYLYALYQLLCESGVECRFFTNGSVLDNNSMAHLAAAYDIPAECFVYPDNTREVVTTIAGLDALVSIRMHASIISYALGIPSVNMVWNEKIPEFYSAVEYPDRAIPFGDCTPELMADKVRELLSEKDYHTDSTYMMSLYHYLLDVLSQLLHISGTQPYTFDEVSAALSMLSTGADEDMIDYRTKLSRTKHCYLTLFNADLDKRAQIKDRDKQLRKTEKESKKQLDKAQAKIEELNIKLDKKTQSLEKTKAKLDKKTQSLEKTKAKLDKKTADYTELKRKLNWVNSRFVVRVYRKLRRIFGLPWYYNKNENKTEG